MSLDTYDTTIVTDTYPVVRQDRNEMHSHLTSAHSIYWRIHTNRIQAYSVKKR
jgi:hypothetical protein